jgi:chromate reductase
MRILAVSGSLRNGSSNTNLLLAAARLAPEGVDVALYGGLADLPPFNPDLESAGVPIAPVDDFRAQLTAAGAIAICSPEYAHGVPGVLKNALDWVVGSGELVDKPLALINASPRSEYAYAQLSEILTVMSAKLIPGACINASLMGRKTLDVDGIVADAELSAALRGAMAALAEAVSARPPESTS